MVGTVFGQTTTGSIGFKFGLYGKKEPQQGTNTIDQLYNFVDAMDWSTVNDNNGTGLDPLKGIEQVLRWIKDWDQSYKS